MSATVERQIMKSRLWFGSIALATALVWFGATPAHANEWNELTYFTFSAPVELPGVALPAGTYMFKHPDVNDLQVVQVFSRDGLSIYGTFLTIPETRVTPTDSPTVTFEETPRGTPEAIKAWFYADSTTGHEFIYPERQEARLADVSD
jgi:hypothetical protein